MQEVKDLRHADVGHRLVDDLLDLNRGDADGQRGAEHDAVLADRLAGDHGRQLHHEPRPLVQVVVSEDLVEGEVVEVLDQFRVGGRERGHAPGEQPVMVASRGLAGHRTGSFTLSLAKNLLGQRSISRCMASGYRAPCTVIWAAAVSIAARSSAVSSTWTAPRFSSSRSRRRVPGMGTIHGRWASCQASAI